VQINNWLNAKRRKNKSNHLEKLDKWLENPSNTNIVFPTKRENFPSIYYEKEGKMIIIIHFGSHLLERFNETVSDTQIVGLDAQFVNNNLRRPLYVICAQDPISFKTIPGFIILLARNDESHLSEALSHIKDFLLGMGKQFPPTFMIDQCITEKNAISKVGGNCLLCDFHFQKLMNSKLKSIKIDVATKIQVQVKKIQRSTNENKFLENCVKLEEICRTKRVMVFWRWYHSFLANWKDEYIDLGRKNRFGIFNTNNLSEAFFKSLLRGFLKGVTSYAPSQLLTIIQSQMIPCLIYKDIQAQKQPFAQPNPTFKLLRKYYTQFVIALNEDRIKHMEKFLFSICENSETFFVAVDVETERLACSCGNWNWFGRCFHTFCVEKIREGDSGFVFEDFDDELEVINLTRASESDRDQEAQKTHPLEDYSDSDGQDLHKLDTSIRKQKIVSQRKRVDLPQRKKNAKKGNKLAVQLKRAVMENSDAQPENPSSKHLPESKSTYQEIQEIGRGKLLGKRIPKKKVIIDL